MQHCHLSLVGPYSGNAVYPINFFSNKIIFVWTRSPYLVQCHFFFQKISLLDPNVSRSWPQLFKVTWRHRLPDLNGHMPFPIGGPFELTDLLFLAFFEIFSSKYYLFASRPWLLRVTWRQLTRGYLVPSVLFLQVLHCNRVSISSRFRDIILGPRYIGITIFTLQGHVTLSVTWPFDSTYAISFWWSIGTSIPAVFQTFDPIFRTNEPIQPTNERTNQQIRRIAIPPGVGNIWY